MIRRICIKSDVSKQEEKHKTLWESFGRSGEVRPLAFRVVLQCFNHETNRTMTIYE